MQWRTWTVGAAVIVFWALAFVALPAAARADIVYGAGATGSGASEIDVARDDGSSAQTIVTAFPPPAGAVQAPGVSTFDPPDVAPGGKAIVFDAKWSGASAEQNKWSPPAPVGECGIWCFGVFKYQSGTVTRVSHDPVGCPSAPCAVFEYEPEITDGGQIVSAYMANSTTEFCDIGCSWSFSNSFVGVDHPPRQDENGFFSPSPASDVPTACSGGNFDDPQSAPTNPSPSPDGTKLVYTGCDINGQYDTVADQNMDGTNANTCGVDDQPIADPSFSLDGSRIVEAEGGSSPGLWNYPSACPPQNTQYVYALAAPSGTSFVSPRYASGGRILFVAIPNGQNGGEVWSIPDTCGQGGTPCQFPQNATQITHTSDDVTGVAWTSQSLVRDTTAPHVSAPLQRLVKGATLGTSSTVPVRLIWSAFDDVTPSSSIESTLQERTKSGSTWSSYSNVAGPTLAKSSVRSLPANATFRQFRVQARDQAGNVGTSGVGSEFRVFPYQESSSAVAYSGKWRQASTSTAWGGGLRSSTQAGAKATLSSTGGDVAVVMPRTSTGGTAKICVDGANCSTVDLSPSTGLGPRRVVYALNGIDWNAVHKVQVTVLSGRVDLDGFVALR